MGSGDTENLRQYYDDQVKSKLRDFIDGNRRVEAAYALLQRITRQSRPRRVVEIGCGIGAVAARLAQRFSSADVLAIDLSVASIKTARHLFLEPNLTFELDNLESPLGPDGQADLVVLMDVYEHVPLSGRSALHRRIDFALSESGHVLLTFPSAQYQRWIATYHPDKMQPVEQQIDPADLSLMASETHTRLVSWQEVSIWHAGDYVHAVLARRPDDFSRVGISNTWKRRLAPVVPYRLLHRNRLKRLNYVIDRLGPDACPDLG
jgi:trans-aconitate methyltransferase